MKHGGSDTADVCVNDFRRDQSHATINAQGGVVGSGPVPTAEGYTEHSREHSSHDKHNAPHCHLLTLSKQHESLPLQRNSRWISDSQVSDGPTQWDIAFHPLDTHQPALREEVDPTLPHTQGP